MGKKAVKIEELFGLKCYRKKITFQSIQLILIYCARNVKNSCEKKCKK